MSVILEKIMRERNGHRLRFAEEVREEGLATYIPPTACINLQIRFGGVLDVDSTLITPTESDRIKPDFLAPTFFIEPVGASAQGIRQYARQSKAEQGE